MKVSATSLCCMILMKSPCLQYLDYFNKRLGEPNRKGVPEQLLKKNLERFKAQQPSTTY